MRRFSWMEAEGFLYGNEFQSSLGDMSINCFWFFTDPRKLATNHLCSSSKESPENQPGRSSEGIQQQPPEGGNNGHLKTSPLHCLAGQQRQPPSHSHYSAQAPRPGFNNVTRKEKPVRPVRDQCDRRRLHRMRNNSRPCRRCRTVVTRKPAPLSSALRRGEHEGEAATAEASAA
nr:hypothetical protein Iba_chr01bCG3270 [Ipomoea batatas]